MDYLTIFQNLEDYEAAKANLVLPNVSLIESTNKIKYLETLPPDPLKEYLTFEAKVDGVKVYFNGYTDYQKSIDVSVDGGNTWIEYTSEEYDENNNTPIATLNAGEKALVRGNNTAMAEANDGYPTSFRIDGQCYVYGNVMSLLQKEGFESLTSVDNSAFSYLFRDYEERWCNVDLLSHPVKKLILPATVLGAYCYNDMFGGCTSLTTAPELPATTLADSCYSYMFNNCSSLTSAPELPATTLASCCYYCMFRGCSSLTSAPELPATTLNEYCYNAMFRGCTSLTTTSELPATTLAWNCYNDMFYGCESLTTAPELPATTLADYCYQSMFLNCTSLTTAPELPATTLTEGCYSGMFYDCTNLNYIKAMFTTRPSISYTSNWVSGVSATGTFVKNSSASWNVSGVNGVPSGWTVQTASS